MSLPSKALYALTQNAMIQMLKSIVKDHYFYGILCAFISFIVYLLTLAPTVYWGDSGELITVALYIGNKTTNSYWYPF